MKTTKVQLKTFTAGMYNTQSAMWAFASKIDTSKGTPGKCVGQVNQLNEFMTCRETFIDFFRQQTRVMRGEINLKINPNMLTFIEDTKNFPVETDAARILVCFHNGLSSVKKITNTFENMKVSLKIANIVEKELGWTKTKMYKTELVPAKKDRRFPKLKADDPKTLETTAIYMFIGSRKYMFSPHMLSLYLLFLRLGMMSVYKDVKDMGTLIEAAKKHTKLDRPDATFVRHSYPYWLMFLRNWRDLYKSRYLLTNYSYDIINRENASVEGIDKLCVGSCKDTALLDRFRALKIKESLKNNKKKTAEK